MARRWAPVGNVAALIRKLASYRNGLVSQSALETVRAAPSTSAALGKVVWKTSGGIPITLRACGGLNGPFSDSQVTDDVESLRLHLEHARLGLLRGFDQLLCLEGLTGVEHLSHQIETVRKVLRHFRGRVLLADQPPQTPAPVPADGHAGAEQPAGALQPAHPARAGPPQDGNGFQKERYVRRGSPRDPLNRERLRGYYNALLREAHHKKTRGHTQPDPEQQEARQRAVKLELRRKTAELDERYAMEPIRCSRCA